MKTLGVVHVEKSPTPHQPAAFRRLAGKPLVEWVVRRVSESQRLSGIVVLTEQGALDPQLAALIPSDVLLFQSQSPRAVDQLLEVGVEFSADALLRVSVSNPFIDPVLIDRLVIQAEAEPECDYASYCQRDGTPAISSPLGVHAEWLATAALHRACAEPLSSDGPIGDTRLILSRPELYQLCLLPLPAELDQDDLRFTVDSIADMELTQEIYEALGPEQLDWQRLAGFLRQQPGLRQQMAALNHKAKHD
jgi:spore coat polysaccharide biosynthesis protein SpsF (cytidylyltransferase family)